MAYEKGNNSPSAKKQFEIALRLNPKSRQADEIKKMLGAS
jgi:hypothetical protein